MSSSPVQTEKTRKNAHHGPVPASTRRRVRLHPRVFAIWPRHGVVADTDMAGRSGRCCERHQLSRCTIAGLVFDARRADSCGSADSAAGGHNWTDRLSQRRPPHVVTVVIIAASLVPFGVDHSTAHGHRIEK